MSEPEFCAYCGKHFDAPGWCDMCDPRSREELREAAAENAAFMADAHAAEAARIANPRGPAHVARVWAAYAADGYPEPLARLRNGFTDAEIQAARSLVEIPERDP